MAGSLLGKGSARGAGVAGGRLRGAAKAGGKAAGEYGESLLGSGSAFAAGAATAGSAGIVAGVLAALPPFDAPQFHLPSALLRQLQLAAQALSARANWSSNSGKQKAGNHGAEVLFRPIVCPSADRWKKFRRMIIRESCCALWSNKQMHWHSTC
jgi:hypothetical protein